MRTTTLIALAALLLPTPAAAAQFSWSAVDCDGNPVAGQSSPTPLPELVGNWACTVGGGLVPGVVLYTRAAGRGQLRGYLGPVHHSSEMTYGDPDSAQGDPASGTLVLEMRFDDFVVSGPPARSVASVEGALRLELLGSLHAEEFDGDSFAAVELEVELAGELQRGRAEFWHSEVRGRYGPWDEGLLAGTLSSPWNTFASLATTVTTPAATLPVGVPFTLRVRATLEGSAWDPFAQVLSLADFYAAGEGRIGFPTSGVVLELPDGYTVHSEEAGVTGNSWSTAVSTQPQSWGTLKARP